MLSPLLIPPSFDRTVGGSGSHKEKEEDEDEANAIVSTSSSSSSCDRPALCAMVIDRRDPSAYRPWPSLSARMH